VELIFRGVSFILSCNITAVTQSRAGQRGTWHARTVAKLYNNKNIARVELVVGVIMIPGAPQLKAKDIKYRINNSQAKCVFGDSAVAEKVDEVLLLLTCQSHFFECLQRNIENLFGIVPASQAYRTLALTATTTTATAIKTRSLAVAKGPCDCCMGQFWPNITRLYFADNI